MTWPGLSSASPQVVGEAYDGQPIDVRRSAGRDLADVAVGGVVGQRVDEAVGVHDHAVGVRRSPTRWWSSGRSRPAARRRRAADRRHPAGRRRRWWAARRPGTRPGHRGPARVGVGGVEGRLGASMGGRLVEAVGVHLARPVDRGRGVAPRAPPPSTTTAAVARVGVGAAGDLYARRQHQPDQARTSHIRPHSHRENSQEMKRPSRPGPEGRRDAAGRSRGYGVVMVRLSNTAVVDVPCRWLVTAKPIWNVVGMAMVWRADCGPGRPVGRDEGGEAVARAHQPQPAGDGAVAGLPGLGGGAAGGQPVLVPVAVGGGGGRQDVGVLRRWPPSLPAS